ncbi:hypothetical protein EJ05DRAFT_471102 [Pseudovirgaria hyperparasitica]|uniref:beta-glucosidase n=1 Tax=Pseudovirgaria hyperparasitica TaxID=470096 RepID=A0A6A6VRH3_9PEZI|nr:uncharacterized protein EJ05DRAFT_471102 [Pseudovirgaria hyperparasitica]KAF2752755.1 hypothetical protein EJ05DRAFT_471102 [Pseudovirgaria hyperparasitica]
MTTEELNNVTYGVDSACSGMIGSASRVGFEGLCYNDIGKTDLVNSYPEGISVAASWNLELAYERGQQMGLEHRKKGVKILLTPVVGPAGRVALGGRNMEGLGADPFLAGKLSAASIIGIQENVISSVKHFVGNEQETYRNPSGGNNVSVSSEINDKDMHELYLWAFQDSVAAGVGCIMCSYQRVNGTYACENENLLNGLLKDELQFPGFVLSDWGAQHSGVPSALSGLDVAMPNSDNYWAKGALATGVQNGSIPSGRLQDMATRQLAATYYVFGDQVSSPPNGYGLVKDYTVDHELVDARDPSKKQSRLQQAIESHVLVKNTNYALPLRSPKILSLFGYDGTVQPTSNPGSGLLGLLWSLYAQGVNATADDFISIISGTPIEIPQIASNGTYFSATGSGSSIGSYISDPYSAISQRAYEDNIYVLHDFQSFTPDVSAASSACLVFLNDFSTESSDRAGLADPRSDSLVTHVADRCANTIVVIHNPFIRILDSFYDHPNVTAILLAHLPGQDSGRALTQVLFGDQSPSGKLPYTIAKNASDYGPLLNASYVPMGNPQVNLSDPSGFDYRYFQEKSIEPRVPFGFGLSYTTFSYSSAHITSNDFSSAPASPPNPTDTIPGGTKSLFDRLVSVAVEVSNTGIIYAAEVAQLYVQFPGESIHVLRGFQKQVINSGETRTFAMELTRRDLSRWDVVSQQWVLPSGTTKIMVGSSSVDIVSTVELVRQ